MANVSAPMGFKIARGLFGYTMNWQLSTYRIASGYSTGIFTGDPVKFVTTGYIQQAAAGNQMRGIFAGCWFTDSTGFARRLPYWPASQATLGSKDAYALVIDDPNVLLECQMDAAMANGIADFGLNYDTTTMAAGSTATGQSIAQLSYSSGATTAKQFRAIDYATQPTNDIAVTQAYTRVIVRPNLHDFVSTTGI